MMKLHCIFFLIVLLTLQSCNEKSEPEPEPVSFLTVTLGNDYYIYEDMWVFATDGNGKVLDGGSVKAGSSLDLKTLSPPEIINLTTYYKGGGSPVNHLFYTYAGINSGDHITLERSASGFLPPVSGKATINIQNCGTYAFFNLSDGHAHSQFNSKANTFVDALFDLRQDVSNILISSHTAMDMPVYGWVNNVTNAGVYAIDFNNLTPFPNTISVLFSGYMSALITGRKAGVGISTGYVMANGGFSTTSPGLAEAKFGYLDGFEEYSVFATTSNTMSTYYRTTHYIKHGTSMPVEITFPDNSLSIENPLIGNFSFLYSSQYNYHSHYWREDATDHIVHWLVLTDQPTTPPITELPEAFTAKYPSLSVDNLSYFQSEFFKHEDGYTYDQLLLDTFAGTTPEHREFFQDSFRHK